MTRHYAHSFPHTPTHGVQTCLENSKIVFAGAPVHPGPPGGAYDGWRVAYPLYPLPASTPLAPWSLTPSVPRALVSPTFHTKITPLRPWTMEQSPSRVWGFSRLFKFLEIAHNMLETVSAAIDNRQHTYNERLILN